MPRPWGTWASPAWTIRSGLVRVMSSPARRTEPRRSMVPEIARIERRLPRAVGAEDDHHLALADGEVDAVEHLDGAVARVDVGHLEEGIRHSVVPR